MEMTSKQQNFMIAIRLLMGWPAFKPANDCLAFGSGKPTDFEVGSELARIATMLGKDVIYSGWDSLSAALPTDFTIIYRELLTVDVVDRVFPWAANDEDPIVFISTRSSDIFAVDRRGSLIRMAGKPKAMAKGRKLAMKRIKATAAEMADRLLENNRFVPFGAPSIEPETPSETVVRFG